MKELSQIKKQSLSAYLMARGLKLSPVGKQRFKTCCPFHDDKHPSLVVDDHYGTFKCFVCDDVQGDIIDFVRRMDGVGFKEAVATLVQHYGLESGSPRVVMPAVSVLDGLASRYESLMEAPDGEEAKAYLLARGISEDVLSRFRVGYASAKTSLAAEKSANQEILSELGYIKADASRRYDFFRNRIMFPVRNELGEVRGFGGRIVPGAKNSKAAKYLNSENSTVFDKSALVYGLFEAVNASRKVECLYVVEGYLDVLACHCVGVTNVVSTCGLAVSADQLEAMYRHTQHLIFVFDGDKAGQSAREGIIKCALPHLSLVRHLSFVELGHDLDPAEYVQQGKPEALKSKMTVHRGYEHFLKQQVQAVKGHSPFVSACLRKEAALSLTETTDPELRAELLNYVLQGLTT